MIFIARISYLSQRALLKKAKEWSGFKYMNVDITGIEDWNISLEQLWEKRKNKGIRFGISYIGVSWKNLK